MHCSKCLHASKTPKPSLKRWRERCAGRADCIADDHARWGHELWEASCENSPLVTCGVCGVWTESMSRGLAKICRPPKPKQTPTALKRIFGEGVHPLLPNKLDGEPRRYEFCEDRHGPSRRSVAVRRLTRRMLAKITPWAEPEANLGPPSTDDEHAQIGCPSAEEEARLFLDKEEYYAGLDCAPFSFGQDEEDGHSDDAEGFWSEIPRQIRVVHGQPDITPAEDLAQ